MRIKVTLNGGKENVDKALIDSGAAGNFINRSTVHKYKIPAKRLQKPIQLSNADGTKNIDGTVKTYVESNLGIGTEKETLLVTSLGKEDVILGMPWLKKHNPRIDWEKGELRSRTFKTTLETEEDQENYHSLNPISLSLGTLLMENVSEEETEDEMAINHLYELKQQEITSKGTSEVPQKYQKFAKVFDKKAADRLPEHKQWDHEIHLIPGAVPKDCKVYPLSQTHMKEADKFINENLEKGFIRPSKSQFASPLFFVDKKDGTYRPCQDYRALNDMTIKNRYPIPRIDTLLEKLQGSEWFTKLDFRAGFNNIRIKEGHEHFGAFKTHRGLFEPLVMFFGMCNSPATFQKMVNELFKDLIDEGWLEVYIDDMLIHSRTLVDQERRTERVLQRLMDNDFYLKLEKCRFNVQEVDFLGMVIKPGQIMMDKTKVDGIASWPTPRTVKDVRSFLGFCNYYRKFIHGYSGIARPLNDLTKKETKWNWGIEQEEAFTTLKRLFVNGPVLSIPDPDKPFQLAVDASKYATGGVLSQPDHNGEWKPCGYISTSNSAAERNYQIYDRELMAIVRGLEAWRHLILGANFPVRVLTDHKNLLYFRSPNRLNPRQARWGLLLSEFNLELEHSPGRNLVGPDSLSRRPDHVPDEDPNEEESILLPEHMFLSASSSPADKELTSYTIAHDDTTQTGLGLEEELKTALQTQTRDDVILDALKALEQGGPLPMKSALGDWEVEDDLIRYKGRFYVPKDESLRRKIVQLHHDSLIAGHGGEQKTLELLKRTYWWPGCATYVSKYVQGCATCQQNKVNTHPTKTPLQPLKAAQNAIPFSQITVDFVTDLPKTAEGYDALMVVVDHGLTKGIILIPCHKTTTAEQTAALFLKHVFAHFGIPDVIISDRGTQFNSKFFAEFCKKLGIDQRMSTAFHPQTDGQTERVNQEVERYLRIFCSNEPENWVDYLPVVQFTHNNRIHSARKLSPFQMIMGYHPRWLPTLAPKSNVPELEERLTELLKIRQEATAAHELARQRMLERVKSKFKPFKIGTKVWLEAKNLRLQTPHRKLTHKREGPFEIEKVLGPLVYRLKLPKKMANTPSLPREPAHAVSGDPNTWT